MVPETVAHFLGIALKNIYNWIKHDFLRIKLSDLPDKGVRQQSKNNGRLLSLSNMWCSDDCCNLPY
jgi:hypothetical protein